MYTILFDEAEERGEKKGEKLVITLMQKLYSLGRNEDVQKAVYDEKYRNKLYEEFDLLEKTSK